MKPSRIILLLVVVGIAAGLYFGGGAEYLSLQKLQSLLSGARDFTAAHPWQSALGFGGVYILATALSLPGATVLTLFAGAVFGLWEGTLIASFAASIGATLAMLVSRYVLRDMVRSKFGKRLKKIDSGVEREGGFYLFALRLVPAFPFFIVNLVMGLTAIRVVTFYWVSQLGMLAGTAVYVNAGRELGQLDSLSGILSWRLILAFVALGLLPLIARKILGWLRGRRVYKGWTKPKTFDNNLIVIGAGAGGLVTSYVAAMARAKVLLIEKAEMGGDCLNRGCVPSKSLIRAARAAAEAEGGTRFGVDATHVIDFAAVMRHVKGAIATIAPHDSVERYRGLGVDVLEASATLVSPWEVEVDGRRISARHIVLATGSQPFVPNIPGLAEVSYCTSDTIWDLDSLPRRLAILGGGPIGCELAQAFARLGSEVTIVEKNTRLLKREDADAAAVVQQALEADGVRVLVDATAIAVEAGVSDDDAHALRVTQGEASLDIVFDTLLVAVGRRANVTGYGLDAIGIPLRDDGTIETDDQLRTRYPNVLCVGDATGPFQFTHASAHQGAYAALNALFGSVKSFVPGYRVMPAVTYTEPEAARVGLTEAQAREQEIEVEVVRVELARNDRAIAERATDGFVKVLVEPGKDVILGASVVGERGGETIALFALAMQHKLGLDRIMHTVFAYPTFAESAKAVAGERSKRHKPEKLLAWAERYHRWMRGGT